MSSPDSRSDQPLVESLTSRELEILALMAENYPNAEIAEALVLSLNTIKWYARQIYGKLGVSNRRQAVARGRDLGLFGAPAPPSLPRHNLPTPLTPFLGRQEELDKICQMMREDPFRLLTVTGPGGIGKTRLAIEVSSCLLESNREGCRDGVFFVPLVTVSDSASLVPSLAQAIGLSFYQGKEKPDEQLVQYLRQRRMLLVLDNFEHLIDGDSIRTLAEILAAAPAVKMLVTSRTRLNIQGEHVLPLGGMAFPDRDSIAGWQQPVEQAESFSGIQLFLQSAHRVWPECCLDPESLVPITEICELVQGMPLGIELAAAWMAVLKPAEIAAEIRESLDFLKTDAADVPERQQSLRAVFDASWKLLTEEERLAVQLLTVFRRGFDRTAAEKVCSVSPQTMLALANKSWIQRTADGGFEMHELLKQYGAEKLAGDLELASEVRDKHSRYYCDWLCQQEEGLKGAEQEKVWAAILGDIENVQAACTTAATQGRLGRLESAVNALGLFYYRGYGYSQPGQKAFRELGKALARDERWQSTPTASFLRTMARIEMWHATCISLIGDEPQGYLAIEESLALLDNPLLAQQETRPERAHIALQLGYLELNRNAEAAKQHFVQSLELYQGLDDKWGMAYALLGFGRAARNMNDIDQAQLALRQSLALHGEIENRLGQSETLATLGGLAIRRAGFEEAEGLIQQSLAITTETDRFAIAFGLGLLGWVQLLTGRFAEAADTATEGITTFADLGIRVNVVHLSTLLARVHLHTGDYHLARGEADTLTSLAQELAYEAGVGYGLEVLGEVALAEGAFADAHEILDESIRVMKQVSIGQRDVGFLAWLGLAARGLQRRTEAWQHLGVALDWAAWAGRFMEQMVAVSGIALMLADEGEVERATELYALALRHPFVANSRWFEDVIGRQIESAASSLPPEVIRKARERGQARDLEATLAELLEELKESQ